jgi:hypothetical protein
VWAAWHDDQDEPPDAHHVVKGDLIPFELVFERVREVLDQYDVQEIAYDPYRIPDDTAERLEAEGLPMTKFPQTHTLMVPASQGLFELVTSRRLLREPDEVLDAHIASAAAKDVPGPRNSWRLDKDARDRRATTRSRSRWPCAGPGSTSRRRTTSSLSGSASAIGSRGEPNRPIARA